MLLSKTLECTSYHILRFLASGFGSIPGAYEGDISELAGRGSEGIARACRVRDGVEPRKHCRHFQGHVLHLRRQGRILGRQNCDLRPQSVVLMSQRINALPPRVRHP